MPAYTVQSKVKVASVFNLDSRDNFDYYTRAEFDFVIFEKASGRPLIVFEVDGPEHINNYRTIRNDRKKEDICRRRNVKLIRVPNENVRRYNLIKNILLRRCLSS
jgi:very-short-patch-repair endonuclease